MDRYALDNDADQAPGRFGVLERHYDPQTQACLTRIGIGAGWRCLEVGARAGSVAAWMADRVGPEGAALFEKVHAAFLRRLAAAGADPLWGRKVFGAMADAGMVGLGSETFAETWAGGGALATVRVLPGAIETRTGAGVRREPCGPGLTGVAGALASLPLREWRAFGWAAFELGHDVEDPETVLMELVVPLVEVRFAPGEALLLGVDRHLMSAAVAVLSGAAPDPGPGPAPIPVDLEADGGYRDQVARAVETIRSGALAKAVISRRVPVPVPVDLPATLVRGREANTPARTFLLQTEAMAAVGFSPETVVEVAADGRVATTPLAGTRALVGDTADDAFLRGELLADPKEVFEHAVSVKAAFGEMAGVCDRVGVEEFMAVVPRGSVQHLASRVTGRLGPGRDCWNAFAVLFPAITASGVPKDAARALIRDLEGVPRGLYAGAVLTCDIRGELDAALVLRSVFQQEERTWLQAGAGLVADSRPDREFEETCEKLRSIAPYLVPAVQPVTSPGLDTRRV